MGRIKEQKPEMVVHIGDTYFDWSNQFVLRTVAGMLEGTPGGAEFHLAPGNHDMKNGSLKEYLRNAATRGVFRLDTQPTFAGNNYLNSRVAAYVPDPLMTVWNPEIVNHPAWQPDAKAKFAALGVDSNSNRYVFKRGRIRFIICDWDYSEDQRRWIRDIVTRPDDSSATILFHHYHKPAKLARYFEGLEGQHNVKLVLSGHDHRYHHEKRKGITYVTAAGIARSGRDCDAMILRVHKNYLRLDRYIIPKGSHGATVSKPSPVWMCDGRFDQYQKPELPRRKPTYVKNAPTVPGPGVFYNSSK
jgi:predicted phosphodiesterase